MASDNGTGSGGGNGSVYWQVSHGNLENPKQITRLTAPGFTGAGAAAQAGDRSGALAPPGRGEVVVGPNRVEGHTNTTFDRIGKWDRPELHANDPEHPGMFRVRLRFRDDDLAKMQPAEREWIKLRAVRITGFDPKSWFLLIDVPAIQRAQPAPGQDWSDQPWEIHWMW